MNSDFQPTHPMSDLAQLALAKQPEVDLFLPLTSPGRKPRLLLVDDQPIHIQVLRKALATDYQLFMATSGEQALRLCAELVPDLVLLDVVMPGMDGFEVLGHLKSQAPTAHIPVIFVTAHGGEDIETRCLQAGAVDFITKPVNPAVVRARVRTHLTLKFQSDFLRDMAFRDGLTGVSNRRYFDERLAEEWGRAQRLDAPLSLVLIDVDFFKNYNDHYGHQAGDDCLRQIAAVLKQTLKRPTDMVARYGGEEFVCLLPDTSFDDALVVAHHMERVVRRQAMPHLFSQVAQVVTVSLGLATREGPASKASYLLALADSQLYKAKRSGRAQVCGARLPPLPAVSAQAKPSQPLPG